MKPQLTIIKIGGGLLETPDLQTQVLEQFQQIPGNKILVHGGGNLASELSMTLGHEPQMIDGRRITRQLDLDIAIMTYAGLINANLSAKLNAKGCKAAGINASAENWLQAKKRVHPTIDYGFVGDITNVEIQPIVRLLNHNVCPIIAPLSVDETGQLLNTNADTIAATLAQTLSIWYQVNLKFVFQLNGVLDEKKEVIPNLNQSKIHELTHAQVLHSGMLPKIKNALDSAKFCHSVSICNWNAMQDEGAGTKIQYL